MAQFTHSLEQGVGHIPPVSPTALAYKHSKAASNYAGQAEACSNMPIDQQLEKWAVTITQRDPGYRTGWVGENNR